MGEGRSSQQQLCIAMQAAAVSSLGISALHMTRFDVQFYQTFSKIRSLLAMQRELTMLSLASFGLFQLKPITPDMSHSIRLSLKMKRIRSSIFMASFNRP